MRRKYTLFWLICCMGLTGLAQDTAAVSKPKKNCSCGFSSINQAGILTGEKSNSLAIQSINGMRYRTWFAGAGIGLDAYDRTSIPVFLDIRKDLWNKAMTPFFYVDGGYHFITDLKFEKGNDLTKYTGSLFYDLGVGYKFKVKGAQSWLLSAGYSVKSMTQTEYYDPLVDPYCPNGGCNNFINRYKYRFNRLSFKVGFQF